MNPKSAALSAILSVTAVTALGADSDDLKPYPAAEPGFERMVFRLPAEENEIDRKVEIVVGKVMEVDCNKTWFGGTLERRVAEGWGFPYYVVSQIGPAASTLMACPPDAEKQEAFVSVRGEGYLQRYNSKLPMVVYVPEGYAVRYRIWSAGEDTLSAAPE